MKKIETKLWESGEYYYEEAYGFEPELHGYLHEDEQIRSCMIVVPGGGYGGISASEGEIVAKRFFEKGYQTFVCVYTTSPLGRNPLKQQPLADLSRAVRWVRSRAEEFQVNPSKLVVCGFSAGAHLCGSLCVHHMDVSEQNVAYAPYSNRPDAAVLSYPVITSGEKAHIGSIEKLVGKNATEDELEYVSLERQVTEKTPPCFIWQTETDECVPVENSYLFAEACRKHGVTYGFHIFSEGGHAMSLADEVWESNQYGELYPLKQNRLVLEKIQKGEIVVTEEERIWVEHRAMLGMNPKEQLARKEVAMWPLLAEVWLENVLSREEKECK